MIALRQSLIRSIPTCGALLIGFVAAASFAAMPVAMLEAIVWRSGIAGLIPAATPPLGATARTILALGGGVALGAVVWSVLYLAFGPGGFFAQPIRREDGVPVVRRADAHPDAPPRRPLSAADLGAPMMAVARRSDDAELPIPADLDQPLAAFDPHALLPEPMEPVRPVASLVQKPVASERIETFDLAPLVSAVPEPEMHPQPEPKVEPVPVQTIEMLLRRLEQGAGRRRGIAAH